VEENVMKHQRDRARGDERFVRAVWSDFCAVAPSPELKEKMLAEVADARKKSPVAATLGIARAPRPLGFDDGVIIPPDRFPLGTPVRMIRAAAAERAPLRGAVRVIVVLVQFPDRTMTQPASHFQELFFSTGVLPNGSVKEYFKEVTGGLVDVVGEIAGPFQLPQTNAWYANNNFGIGRPSGTPRANIMARDAAVAADPTINFGQYDNDGNGFIDAFIVVHPGGGGEQTGNPNDIWSHKWVLPSAYNTDGKQIFAYLTIPEDARIGVCAHELGHLLFGFPDLYDTDDTSEGVGNWCLMGGGSWNGNGDIPADPSAWCKVQQGWVTVTNVTTNGTITFPDVKTSRTVHRVWKDGAGGSEYFLLENRQRTKYDARLPGDGLLIWHIDESQPGNTDENHYKVGLVQADGKRNLELAQNRGDAGDPYPGTSGNISFNSTSTPNSKSYAGQDTNVSVSAISASAATMTAAVSVTSKSAVKDSKDQKDRVKEGKETKEGKDGKETKETKESKELAKDRKDQKDRVKEGKDSKESKELFKERKDFKDRIELKVFDRPGGGLFGGLFGSGHAATPTDVSQAVAELDARVTALETALGMGGQAEPFIGSELRPDLVGGPDYSDRDNLIERMASGDRDAKIAFDNLPPK
jgi:immune inhibitor A